MGRPEEFKAATSWLPPLALLKHIRQTDQSVPTLSSSLLSPERLTLATRPSSLTTPLPTASSRAAFSAGTTAAKIRAAGDALRVYACVCVHGRSGGVFGVRVCRFITRGDGCSWEAGTWCPVCVALVRRSCQCVIVLGRLQC